MRKSASARGILRIIRAGRHCLVVRAGEHRQREHLRSHQARAVGGLLHPRCRARYSVQRSGGVACTRLLQDHQGVGVAQSASSVMPPEM